jgi:ABC-2 type transport system ATP-binding protein
MLRLEGVSKSYDGVQAVRDLGLEVPAGTVFGLLGPNGAGKTTTIRMIMRIILPDEGAITLDGEPFTDSTRNRVGYLPEERGLYRKMKVREALGYLGEIKGLGRRDAMQRAGGWLERLDLGEWAEKKVEELSKGMQQKAQFISTILHEPEIVILDEPFSGLDPINTEVLKEIIQEFAIGGRTVIFSTHVMEQVEQLCERICLINRGRKVLDGRVRDIKDEYGHNTIRVRMDGEAPGLGDLPGVVEVRTDQSGARLRLRDGADPQKILKTLVARGGVLHFEVMAPTVHEIFLERVRGRSGGDAPGEEQGRG